MNKDKNKTITLVEEDTFIKIKARMFRTNRFEVMDSDGCINLRNNKLGIYCRLGKRRIKRFNDKIVCLDCDESRCNWLEVNKEEFESIDDSDKAKKIEDTIIIKKKGK
jgi:hypothetical protein